jgi:hypothetical protein
MKIKTVYAILFLTMILNQSYTIVQSFIRVNQLGYLPKSIKVAVLLSKDNINPGRFELADALTDVTIKILENVTSYAEYPPYKSSFRLDFSNFEKEGA